MQETDPSLTAAKHRTDDNCLSSASDSSFFSSNVSYRLPQVSSWVVYAGIVTRSSAKMSQHVGHAVEKIIYNKNYNHRSHDSDIALMKLQTPLNFSGQSGSLLANVPHKVDFISQYRPSTHISVSGRCYIKGCSHVHRNKEIHNVINI